MDIRLGKKVLLLVILTVFVGVAGFMIIEGWSFFDALYMVVITLTTIGYGEVQPLSPAGRIFNIFFITIGVTMALYALSTIASLVIGGNLQQAYWRKKMAKSITTLKEHYIVCGLGRVGLYIASVLDQEKQPFVVIDTNENTLENTAEKNHWNFILGDASSEEILKQAGVSKAKGIIICTHTDANNVYITLSARMMNPKISIVARGNSLEAHDKLVKAGADQVISPHVAGGKLMVSALLKPHVTNFLESTFSPLDDVYIEEIEIKPKSSLANITIKKSDLHHQVGVTILAIINHKDKKTLINPPASTMIEANDKLLIVGNKKQIKATREL
ncbi:MAG: potassium channel protein [bacterium]